MEDGNNKIHSESTPMIPWIRGKVLNWSFFCALVSIILGATMYYCYLGSLYFVDELLDIPRNPQNFNIEHRYVSIRTSCIDSECSFDDIKTFAAHYSKCPVTSEIQIYHSNDKWQNKELDAKTDLVYVSREQGGAALAEVSDTNVVQSEGD